MDSSISQISQENYLLSLDDAKKVKEFTNHIESYKGRARDMFKAITSYNMDGNCYLTWMSKNWLCSYFLTKIRDFDLKKDEQIDLIQLSLRYPEATEEILGQEPSVGAFRDLPYHASRQIRFLPMQDHFFNVYCSQDVDEVVRDNKLKELFLTEKDEFEEKYFNRKLYDSKVRFVKFVEPQKCLKCNAAFNAVFNTLSVCSNPTCGYGRRNIADIPRLPNLLFKVRFEGYKQVLEGSDLILMRKLQPMPKMPVGFKNNLFQFFKAYRYTNTIVWRGSLIHKPLRLPISVVPPSLSAPIYKAKQMENRLPLEIKTVKYISGRANRGVFALVDIPAFTVVSVYTGEMMLTSQFPFWHENDSIVEFGWNHNDGISLYPYSYANVGRFFNGVVDKEKPNMKICWTLVRRLPEEEPELVLFLYTTECVPAKAELKWDYGKDFTQRMIMTL